MTTRILHRKTSVKDRAPIADDTASNGLLPGELGINYNVDSPTLFIRDSDNNIIPFVPGGNASVTVGPNPPGSPAIGDLWWDPESGTLFIYYTDNDSSQWVPASPQGSGGGDGGSEIESYQGVNPPPNPELSNLWYNTNDGAQYIYTTNAGGGKIWVQIIS